jgi:hypothetical protein
VAVNTPKAKPLDEDELLEDVDDVELLDDELELELEFELELELLEEDGLVSGLLPPQALNKKQPNNRVLKRDSFILISKRF